MEVNEPPGNERKSHTRAPCSRMGWFTRVLCRQDTQGEIRPPEHRKDQRASAAWLGDRLVLQIEVTQPCGNGAQGSWWVALGCGANRWSASSAVRPPFAANPASLVFLNTHRGPKKSCGPGLGRVKQTGRCHSPLFSK